MSNYYYEKELKGGRETALKAVHAIEADFQRYISSSHKDAPKNGLRFAINMLATFYSIYRTSKETAHYDIFVDIYVRVLAPHMDAEASPEHFRRLLPSLRHLFLTLASLKSNAETEKLYKCIAEQQTKWSEVEDFKYLINIHGAQIILLLESAAVEAHKIDASILKLVKLFKFVSTRCQQSELNCLDLTNSFMTSLKINTTRGCTLISTNLNKRQRDILFEAYFELLNVTSLKPLVATITPEVAFQAQLKASYNLLNMDISTNLEHQLMLKHFRMFLRIPHLKQHGNVADGAQSLYNLIKLSYMRVIANNFKEHYKRACEYFSKLIIKADKLLLKEAWFQSLLLIVYQLQVSMNPTTSNVFYVFWEQLDDTLFAAHFYFLQKLIEALPYTKNSDLFSPYAQPTLASTCFENYRFMINKFEFCNREPFTPTMLAINKYLNKIAECAKCDIINMENNTEATQNEIRKFNRDLTNLMSAAKNPSQASFLIELSQGMENLKTRLPSADWQLLLRRLYQLGAKTQHADTAAELHCCYIAELIASKSEHTVSFLLHNQIHFFYNGICSAFANRGNCLVELYTESKSVLKPFLQKHHIRLLHWLEAQYIFKFYKKDTHAELLINLAMRSQSKYDFLLAASAGKLLDRQPIKSKVKHIYELLRSTKKNDTSNLSRMHELSLAHAAYLLWLEKKEKQVTNLKNPDFVEANLSRLMQEKILANLNVQNETEIIKISLDALHAFKNFYERADIEPIPVDEGGFIDWLIILESLTNLATYFQISGYIDYATEAWSLQYRIAKTIGDTQYCVRSLTFFCEYNHFFDGGDYENLNISDEVAWMSSQIINTSEELPQMLRRHQNFTLICLCQIAYFVATKGRMEDAQIYLKYVKTAHAELRRGSQYDIVLFTADVVQFRILWKFNTDNSEGDCNRNSLLTEIDAILKRVETFVNISSVDATLFSLLTMSAVSDFADFIANRLTEHTLGSFFAYCLKLSVDFGAAMLTARMLLKWAMINLQMEYLQRAEIKFLLIESILGLRSLDKVAAALKPLEKCATPENQPSLIQLNSDLDYVRKVAVISPKASFIDKKQCISSMAFDLKLNKFLEMHKNKESVQSPISHIDCKENLLLWTRFVLGALRARFNFLAKNYDELEHFYESGKKWLGRRQTSFHFKLFYAEMLMSMANYANFLRSSQKFDEAIELLELYLKQFDKVALAANVDPACKLNFQLQLEHTKLEQLERKNRILPTRKRLESAMPAKEVPTTPINKTTRYAQLPMTAYKKTSKATTAFTIYSDRKSSCRAPEKHTLLSGSSTRKDLQFTETDEKQKVEANDVIELLSDSEDKEKQMQNTPKFIFTETIDLDDLPNPTKREVMKTQSKKTLASKTKKIQTRKEDQLAIEHSMENLTIETQTVATSESEELSPQPSTFSVVNNDSDVFKTPMSSLASSSSTKSKAAQKSESKSVGGSKKSSGTSSSGNSSDTCLTDEQITDRKASGMRRLRSRQTAVVGASKASSSSSSTAVLSKRRPR